MQRMAIVIAVTLYFTFVAFLLLPHLGAPPIFGRMAIGLCTSEFIAAVGWGMSHQQCGVTQSGDTLVQVDCSGLADTFENAAALQIPALTAATFVVATAYGLFVARRW
jgi:hypothetical protein